MNRLYYAWIGLTLGSLALLSSSPAWAQATGGAAPAPAAPAAGGAAPAGGAAAPTGGSSTTPPATGMTVYGPVLQPTPAGQPLGGGNIQGTSSSQPITGNGEDHFDLGQTSGGGGTVHGSENGSFVMGGTSTTRSDASIHTVRRGDTLWGICDSYFKNPYQWPRIWSYNPQIQNPHWIYPGDQVRLRGGATVTSGQTAPTQGQNLTDLRRKVGPETIFLRNEGYVEDDQSSTWGEITGSREDKMFLDDYDEVYVRIAEGHEVKLGQELTVFRPVRSVGGSKLVQIQGTIRIDEWNPGEHVARGRIVETQDVIERGAFVGPIVRKYEVVPPKRNEQDVTATITSSVHTHVVYGKDQVIFLDRGDADGLKPGNRLFVLRKGDAWHQSLPARSSAQRIAIESDDPAATEVVPRPRDESKLPDEVLAEIRVITVRQHSAMALVTNSVREVEVGDPAFAKKGY